MQQAGRGARHRVGRGGEVRRRRGGAVSAAIGGIRWIWTIAASKCDTYHSAVTITILFTG